MLLIFNMIAMVIHIVKHFQQKNTFIDIIEESKKASSWKIKIIFGVVFEYVGDHQKVEMEIFNYSINEKTSMLKNDLMHLLMISLNHS